MNGLMKMMATKKHVINIQQEVNPAFKSVWTSNKPYNILKGGRNSFKSSVIALKLAYEMLRYISINEKANIVIIRKVANTIRDSVFLKIQWALDKFGMLDQFNTTVAPFRITHKGTGSTFYFYGSDDFQKLKSNDINDIIAVWVEEAAEFDSEEEFDQLNITFMRQKHHLAPFVYFFWSYNPPRNSYSWINIWSEKMKKEKDYLVHESSYKDDVLGFVTEQMLADINRVKKNDYDYYRYLYLGEPVGLGTEIYNMEHFQVINEIPSDDSLILADISIDTGYSISATAMGAYGLTKRGNVILLDTYYYDPSRQANKKAPSDFAKDIVDFTKSVRERFNVNIDMMTIDSADSATRNQIYKDYGTRLHPVKKKKKVDMIDNVIDLLVRKRFFVLNNSNNDIILDEN